MNVLETTLRWNRRRRSDLVSNGSYRIRRHLFILDTRKPHDLRRGKSTDREVGWLSPGSGGEVPLPSFHSKYKEVTLMWSVEQQTHRLRGWATLSGFWWRSLLSGVTTLRRMYLFHCNTSEALIEAVIAYSDAYFRREFFERLVIKLLGQWVYEKNSQEVTNHVVKWRTKLMQQYNVKITTYLTDQEIFQKQLFKVFLA